jgi:hypothetical protein
MLPKVLAVTALSGIRAINLVSVKLLAEEPEPSKALVANPVVEPFSDSKTPKVL